MARAAGLPLADTVATLGRKTARETLRNEIAVEVLIFDRAGGLVGRSHG